MTKKNKNVLAANLTVKYSINNNRFNDTFTMYYSEIQELINIIVILIDQFSSTDLEITTSDSFYTEPSNIISKQAVMEHIITNLERMKDLINNTNNELTLTIR